MCSDGGKDFAGLEFDVDAAAIGFVLVVETQAGLCFFVIADRLAVCFG